MKLLLVAIFLAIAGTSAISIAFTPVESLGINVEVWKHAIPIAFATIVLGAMLPQAPIRTSSMWAQFFFKFRIYLLALLGLALAVWIKIGTLDKADSITLNKPLNKDQILLIEKTSGINCIQQRSSDRAELFFPNEDKNRERLVALLHTVGD